MKQGPALANIPDILPICPVSIKQTKEIVVKKMRPISIFVFILCFLSGCGSTPKASGSITYDTALLTGVSMVTSDKLFKDWVKVSPDGTKLLYCESNKTVSRSDLSETSYNYWNIMLLRDTNIAAKTPLITDYAYAPAWYENNTSFIYVVNEGGSDKLVRSSISGGGKTYITRNPIGTNDAHPVIRNGVILCDTEMNGKRQIVSLLENGTGVTILGEGYAPSWHPFENKFVFIKNGDIYEMNPESNQVTQIYSDNNFVCAMPSYSQNGDLILFQKGAIQKLIGTQNKSGGFLGGLFGKKKSTVVDEENRWHLFTVRPDGTNLSQLTSGNVDVYSPCWGKDNEIYFVSNSNGSTEIWKAWVNFN
jgi:TolB protein